MRAILIFASLAVMTLPAYSQAGSEKPLQVTLATKQSYSFMPSSVMRIRKSLPSDASPVGDTRVDAVSQLQVLEKPEAVAARVKAQMPSLVRFTTIGGAPVWVDGKKASGPWFVPKSTIDAGAKSGVALGGKVVYVTEDATTVARIIEAAGGSVLPVYQSNSAINRNNLDAFLPKQQPFGFQIVLPEWD